MFGLIRKKKIAELAKDIYMNNVLDKVSFEKTEDRICHGYFQDGNANALNSLCYKIGINLTQDYIVPEENKRLIQLRNQD